LLKRLYAMYGDWAIVIAAYNCGSGTIRGAIKAAGGKKSFWAIYPYLPKQTRIYMPIFIAYNYVLEYADEYNIQPATIENLPAPPDTIHTNRRTTLQQVAKATGTPIETIRMMNPQYLQGVAPAGRDNIICLPPGKAKLMRKFVPEAEEEKTTPETTTKQ
ncbi:MAG: transglycosylase SLT domain-containing protein, partial [Paludibacteraceae bacterium]|nr:transglycosylase SLT domain-containing protein [Paludibacteraceae bacterium]